MLLRSATNRLTVPLIPGGLKGSAHRGVAILGFGLDQEIVIGRLKGRWSEFSLEVRREVLRLRAQSLTLSR